MFYFRKSLYILTIFIVLLLLFIISFYYVNVAEYKVRTFRERVEGPFKDDFGGGSSPEEAYRSFYDALIKNDVEKALEFVYVTHRSEIKDRINADSAGFVKSLYKFEKLKPGNDPTFTYYWINVPALTSTIKVGGQVLAVSGGSTSHRIYFRKTINGKWQIESL